MAVEVKIAPDEKLEKVSVFLEDRRATSQYFNLTEFPDTFTGGKNAFLIAGTDYLNPNTEVVIQIRDANGKVVYTESSDGSPEYYEGTSKVIAAYVYPDDSVEQAIDATAFGLSTITILGELKYYDNNGSKTEVPEIWKNKYNVKWVGTVNINPRLANTTKVRFFLRPRVSISEILSPIYRIESGSKVDSGVFESFANIKINRLETFAGDVKRVKVYRTSEGDISDYSLIQDILIESKELLQTFDSSGSVIADTGVFTSEIYNKFWNTGSLTSTLDNTIFTGTSAAKLQYNGNFTYTSSLDLSDKTTYELSLDGFYSASIPSNMVVYISGSTNGAVPIATLRGVTPTKNFENYITQFTLPKSEPSASLYFSQKNGSWYLKDISLRAAQDTAFSPNEISFITSMPTIINNQTYNFKFEFYDVNNNYVPVAVTQSANFTGGNLGQLVKSLTFDSDRTAFRFSTGSIGNPPFQQVGFRVTKINLSGGVTYGSAAFDTTGNYIVPASYAGDYPGKLTNTSDAGATLTIANFSGSVSSVLVGSILYTASCDGLEQFETIYRFEDGENSPGIFVSADVNQFIYKATDLSLNPIGQTITIDAKRKNLASANTPLTVTSASGKPPLTFVSTNSTTGVDTYTLAGSNYPYLTGETSYTIFGSDQFSNQFSDTIKISPVKILDGISVTLTNDNVSLPARSNGFIETGSFSLSSGSVSVKVGNENIQRQEGLSNNNRFDIISAIGTNCTPNDTTPDDSTYGITTLTQDSGSLSLLIRYKDGAGDTTDVSKLVTYTRNKKAAPSVTFSITPQAQTVSATSSSVLVGTIVNPILSAFEGTTELTYNPGTLANSEYKIISISGVSVSSTTPLTSTINVTGLSSDDNTGVVIITYKDSEGNTGNSTIKFTITKSKSGINGVNGSSGSNGGNGPGVVFRGPWSPTTIYYDTDDFPTRRDAVLYNQIYYATITNPTTNLNKQPDNFVTFWEELGSSSYFVAAEIAIFKESYVQNTINIGTNSDGNANITLAGGTNSPYISVGQPIKGYNQIGAWIGSNGVSSSLSLKSSTNSLLWDGTSLNISGVINVTGGNAATQTYAQGVASSAASSAQASAEAQAATYVTQLANGGWTAGNGTFISSTTISSPVIAGDAGYISSLFKVGENGITLDGRPNQKKIYVGTGTYANNNTPFYFASGSTDIFSLGSKLKWNGSTLDINGSINITGGSGFIPPGGAVNDINGNSLTTTINGGKITTGTIDASKIRVTNLAALNATIGGWIINENNIASPLSGINNISRLILSPAPSIQINDVTGAGKLFIKSGPLTDFTAGISTISLSFQSVNLPQTSSINDLLIINGSYSQFTAPRSAVYSGIIAAPATYTAVADVGFDSGWNGYLFVGLQYQIATDTGFNSIISQGTIAGKGIGNVSTDTNNNPYLDLPGRVSQLTLQLVNGTTYYYRLRWEVVVNSPTSVQINFKPSGIKTTTLTNDITVAEFTDEGLQLISPNSQYFRIQRETTQGLNGAYVRIGGILEVSGDIISLASDRRLKENIIPIDSALSKIDKLNGVYFNYTNNAREYNPNFGEGRQVGLIAQEVQSVLPEVIKFAPFDFNSDGSSISGENYLTLNYDKVIPLLLQGIKELKSELDAVKKLIK